MRARAADRDRGEFLEIARKEAKAAEAKREARRSAAFGPRSLFGSGLARADPLEAHAPQAPSELPIEILAGLPSGDANATWKSLGQVTLGGMANMGDTCYANSVVQVLLRLPAIAAWLHAHASHCEVRRRSRDSAEARCTACDLWATRLQFGSGACPELVRQRVAVDQRFGRKIQHDAAEFLHLLLDRMRTQELQAGRAAEWVGVQSSVTQATHVDRLFGFVEETRLECKECRSRKSRCAAASVLVLPVPPQDQERHAWTVTDLYFLWASREDLAGEDAVVCEPCGKVRTAHVQQRRIHSRPNILIVQVRRTRQEDSDALRHSVVAEEELSLPGVGSFELASVVYHSGRRVTSGHYTCVSRGADGTFWRFDDEVVRRLALDVGRLLTRSVYVLIYTRPGGAAVFAGMGSLSGPTPGDKRDVVREGCLGGSKKRAATSVSQPPSGSEARTDKTPRLTGASGEEGVGSGARDAAAATGGGSVASGMVASTGREPDSAAWVLGGRQGAEDIAREPLIRLTTAQEAKEKKRCLASEANEQDAVELEMEQAPHGILEGSDAKRLKGDGVVRSDVVGADSLGVRASVSEGEGDSAGQAASLDASEGQGATEPATEVQALMRTLDEDVVSGVELVGADGSAAGSHGGAESSAAPGRFNGESPLAADVVPAWSLACFRSRAACVAPERGEADCKLLEPLPVDIAHRVYGIRGDDLATPVWHVTARPLGGVRNLGATCFVNATVQVLARVEGFVRCLYMHTHRIAPANACVVCALRDQVDAMREGSTVERSPVALLARAGLLDPDFVGDATTGTGPQCDAWDCLWTCVEALNVYEGDKLVPVVRDWSPEQRARIGDRRVTTEHVCGMLFRTRVRCALCTGVSDTLRQLPCVELMLSDNVLTSLQGLWEHHVKEDRSQGTLCPHRCGGNAYTQKFLEREAPVIMFRLMRFYQELEGGELRDRKDRRCVDFPEVVRFLRSGEYHFAAAVQHQGHSLGAGHYVTTVWEGANEDGDRYREYGDDNLGPIRRWIELPGQRLKRDAYVLVYVRTRFWGDRVGDGSESTPYLRDGATLDVARRFFRGRPVLAASDVAEAAVVDDLSDTARASRGSFLRPRAVRASRVVSECDTGSSVTEARGGVE